MILFFLNDCMLHKLLHAIFEKKVPAVTSISPKMTLETRKWPPWPATGAPGLKSKLYLSPKFDSSLPG